MEVYKAIPCTGEKKELPEKINGQDRTDYYACFLPIYDKRYIACCYNYKQNRWFGSDFTPIDGVTHWLKKVEIPEMTDDEIIIETLEIEELSVPDRFTFSAGMKCYRNWLKNELCKIK